MDYHEIARVAHDMGYSGPAAMVRDLVTGEIGGLHARVALDAIGAADPRSVLVELDRIDKVRDQVIESLRLVREAQRQVISWVEEVDLPGDVWAEIHRHAEGINDVDLPGRIVAAPYRMAIRMISDMADTHPDLSAVGLITDLRTWDASDRTNTALVLTYAIVRHYMGDVTDAILDELLRYADEVDGGGAND